MGRRRERASRWCCRDPDEPPYSRTSAPTLFVAAGGSARASTYIGDLKAFRDAATALLIEKRGARSVARSWHAFCDDDLPSTTRRCCPGDQGVLYV